MIYAKWVAGLLLSGLLLARPQAAALGAAQAMKKWYDAVAPSLFPFLVLMPLLTGGEAADIYEGLFARTMKGLFALPGAAASAVMIGMLSGTPAGAIAARNVAAGKGMKQGELHRLAAVMIGYSPAFLIGGIGAGMLNDPTAGWKLLVVQWAAQLTLLRLLRKVWRDRSLPVPPLRQSVTEAPVRNAVLVLITVCGYMALFGCLASVIRSVLGDGCANVLLCLLDVPSGALLLAEGPLNMKLKMILLAAMCGFGGICVISQGLAALKGCGIKLWQFVAVRVVAAGIGAGYMALMLKLPELNIPLWMESMRKKPLEAAGLAVALLALPLLAKAGKTGKSFRVTAQSPP